MTTAAAGKTGGSATSPTATQGADTASSPAAETTTPQLTGRAAIAADIEELGAEAAEAEDGSEGEQQPTETEAKDAGAAEPQGDKSKDKGKAAEKMIPERAFKERLAREKKKLDDLKGQLADRDLTLKNSKEALALAASEIERLKGLLRDGAKYDEQGEKLGDMELSQKARDAADRIKSEHEKELQKAKEEAELSVVVEQLGEEVDAALAAHDLVHRSELIAEMKKDPSRNAEEVAAALELQKLEKARGKLVKERPSHPSTVRAQRAGGTNVAVKYSNDRKGIAEHIDALRAQQG